jgi:hypothetical protein
MSHPRITECFSHLIETRFLAPLQTTRSLILRDEVIATLKSLHPHGIVKKIATFWEPDRMMAIGDRLNVLALADNHGARSPALQGSSREALNRLGVALSVHKPADTANGRSVVISSLGQTSVRVFPAIALRMHEMNGARWPIYAIPSGDDGWVAVAPEAHGRFLREAHLSSARRIPVCIQLMKFWISCSDPKVYMRSFYLELVCAMAMDGAPQNEHGYQTYFCRALQVLQKHACGPIPDPLGICAPIPCSRAPELTFFLRDRVKKSADEALKAIQAEEGGDQQSAWSYWNLVFNGRFPQFEMTATSLPGSGA